MSKRRTYPLFGAMCVAFALVTSPLAGAHTTLVSSTPVAGSSLSAVPAQVSATFDEPVESAFASLTVTGPDGGTVSEEPVAVAGSQLSVKLPPMSVPGDFTAHYRLIAADGHVVTGSWTFAVAPSP